MKPNVAYNEKEKERESKPEDYPNGQRTRDAVNIQRLWYVVVVVAVAVFAADFLDMGCHQLLSMGYDMDCYNDCDKDCSMSEWAVRIVALRLWAEQIPNIVYYDEAIVRDR